MEQLNGNPRSGKRYEFRERRSKPDRFDQNLYDEVFDPMLYAHTPAHHANPKKRRRRGSSSETRKRGSRRTKNRRLREQEKEEQSDEDEDDDEVEVEDQGNYDMTDESDIEVINRRIEAQERAQARAEALAEQALAPRYDRATRYALRSRESDVGTTSSISPSKNSDHEHHDAGAEDEEGEEENEDEENEADEENGSQSDNEDNDDDDREEPKDEGDGDNEEDANDAGRRYSLRQRTSSRLVSEPYDDSDRVVGRKAAKPKATISKVARNRRGRASSFIANDTERRYSLRDRSKVQRAEAETPPKDPAFAAYAEYAKRQSGRKPNTGARHRFVFPSKASSSKNRRRQHHRHRSDSISSSSSSSSSSSDKYDDDSDGGMRRSSPGKGSGGLKRQRTGKNARADITPVEVDRSITWESVGGLEKHIEALKEMVMLPLLYPEFYEKYKINPPSGVLFYGPPGTGKTLLARALANSCSEDNENLPATMRDGDAASTAAADGESERPKRQVTFYMRKGADCLSKWVGEAERQLRLLFEEAKRNQPSIIFFDEIDGLAPVRSAKQDQIHASIVSTLLALMDGMDSRGRVVVIGATNRLDSIDPALRRPGRFDRELGFKLPNVRERQKMLGIHSKKWRPTLTESFIQEIAEHTVGYCGADIKALCAEAALCSLRRTYPQVYGSQDKLLIDLDKVVVSRGDFLKAIKKITPASHRTVSSFAAPLPRPVKILLEASLKLVLKSISRRFPLFPLDRQAIDESITGNSSGALDEESSDDDDADDHDIYAKDNHDDCDICHGDEGELLCCDSCPGAFHASCIATVESLSGENTMRNAGENDDDMWFCPDCAVIGPKNAEARKKRLHLREKTKLLRGMPLHVGFPRVLITGTPGMGQEYIGAGLLHALEGLTHFSLDYPSLVADPNTHHAEEALIYRMNEAQKCLPCVLYMPHAEMWWENTTESMHVTLKMMLMNMQIKANLPVLFLACTSSSGGNLPVGLLDLFRHNETIVKSSILFQLKETPKVYRMEHFEQVFTAFATPPHPMQRKKKARVFEKLPLAPVSKKPNSGLSPEMLQRQRERDQHFLRELRIFLGQVLDYATSQKAYTPFYFPVNPDEVPDYYLIVDNPMDLSTMREKLNDGEYSCFEQFMADIRLIVRNANVFNPRRSATRHIAYAAGTMKDNIMSYAHRFRSHQGYDLFAKCREISKRLQSNPGAANGTGVASIVTALTSTSATQALNSMTRTSARIRGVKAPEPWLEDMPKKRETSSSLRRGAASKENSQSEKTISKTVVIKEEQSSVTQWFDEDNDESIESTTKSVTTEKKSLATGTKSGRKRDADVDLTAPGEGDDEVVVFHNGDHVFVRSRTYPGMNREGGAGVIVRTNDDSSYNVKYILGGSEKYVPGKYITRLTESAVKESVRNQRNGAMTESPPRRKAAPDISAIADTKVATEIKMDYFNKLVWPILVEEGWRREDLVEIVEATEDGVAGFATEVAKFYPPKAAAAAASGENSDDDSSEAADVELEGVSEVLAYIKADIQLSVKCFGKRFAVELMDDVAFGSAGSEDMIVVEESHATSIAKDDASDSPAESTGDVDMDGTSADPGTSRPEKQQRDEQVRDSSAQHEQRDDEESDEDEEEKEEPAFIYDKVRSGVCWLCRSLTGC